MIRPGSNRRQLAAQAWSPARLGLGISFWYDASDTRTIMKNGLSVAQWNDKSGLGYHLIQSTASLQPGYQPYTTTSMPYMDFSATGSYMATSQNYIAIRETTPRACFGVFTLPANNGGYLLAFGWNTSMQSWCIGGNTSKFAYVDVYGTNVGPAGSTPLNQKGLITAYYTGGTGAILGCSYNGGTPTTAGATLYTSDASNAPLYMSYQQRGLGNGATQYAHEYIMLRGNLTPSVIAMVQGWLAWKWGIANLLPSTHQYRLEPPQ